MTTDTYYRMTDAELAIVRAGIVDDLDKRGNATQKARGINPLYMTDPTTLNNLASCTIALKNRIYPDLKDFDVVDAIIAYGHGLTGNFRGATNMGYRVLTCWMDDHNIEKPKVVADVKNIEQNLSTIFEALGTAWPDPEKMNGYSHIVPPDKEIQPDPPAEQSETPAIVIDPYIPNGNENWLAFYLMYGGTMTPIQYETDPTNPYHGLYGLDWSGVEWPEIKPKVSEDEPTTEIPEVVGFVPKVKLNPPTKEEEELKALIEAGLNVFIAGPPGLGKTYTVEQYCARHNIPLFMCTSPQMAVDIIGFTDANGHYVPSEFVKGCLYHGRCIILIEEIDRSLPDALIPMNSAIANGLIGTLGLGTLSVNPDAIFIATANTNGLGMTEDIVSAQQLDGSTLDRFVTTWVQWSHDVALSMADGDTELVEFAEDFREAREGVRMNGGNVTYRAVRNMTALRKSAFKFSDARMIEICITKHMYDKTALGSVVSSLKHPKNRYAKALKGLYDAMPTGGMV